MSSTKLTSLTKTILLSPAALGLIGVGLFYFQEHHVIRSAASVESKSFTPRGLVLGKQAAAMTVEIVGPQNYPENGNETVELVGYITQHLQGDGGLSYMWTLPEGVELVRGPATDNLNNLSMGKPQTVTILVRGFTREAQKLVSLQTTIMTNNNPLTASAVIVSRPEETMEAKVMDLKARAAADAEEVKAKKKTRR